MSFAFDIKKELLMKEFSVDNADAFLAGLITVSGTREGSKTIVKMNNPETSEVIRDLITQMKIKVSYSKENKNFIVFEDYQPISLTEIKLPAFFFAGAFVGGGSISDVDSVSYHLELQLYSHQNAIALQAFLSKHFHFTLIQRRTLFVLYLKKSEQISDFLRAIEAYNSLMTFENKRIERDFKNQLNRYSNLDSYNQSKLADASIAFMEQYDFIKKKNMQKFFNQKEIDFFELKRKNQYSSLQELTDMMNEKYGLNKTRAGLNHWLIKLRKVYDDESN